MTIKKDQDKGKQFATNYLDNDYMIETIYHEKIPKYAVVNGKGPVIQTSQQVTKETHIYPYSDPFDNLSKGSILLPTDIEDYITTEKLLEDIRSFISKYCYMPEFWLELSSYYALMTWIYERFESIPYLEFLGDKDSGKTRIGKTISECCFNLIKMNGAGSVSVLFRLMDRYRGTLFVDEADYKHSEFDSELAKIINCGYTRDGVVWRTESANNKYEPRAFGVYGPKILSHREAYKDDATRSRCISFIVPKESIIPKHIPIQLPFEFSIEGAKIRNKALRWRFDNLRNFTPNLTLGKELNSRYREITIPLLNLIKDTNFSKKLIEFIADSSKEAKDDSELYICVQALVELSKKGKSISPGDIANEVCKRYMIKGDDIGISAKKAGYLLKLLQFKTRRVTSGYVLDLTVENKEKIKSLALSYALDE